jgi:hypothetical protein
MSIMKNIATLVIFYVLSFVFADDKFKLASIGDSYAAGAAGGGNFYDGNKDWCWRWSYAWENMMATDNSWTSQPIDFSFAACSGAKLISAAVGDPEINFDKPQLSLVGTPYLLTMQLGGNNAHFSDIARDCIYLGSSNGKEYPDPDSGCTQSINLWGNYIKNESVENGFKYDYVTALNGILNWPTIKGRSDFYLYTVVMRNSLTPSPQIATGATAKALESSKTRQHFQMPCVQR